MPTIPMKPYRKKNYHYQEFLLMIFLINLHLGHQTMSVKMMAAFPVVIFHHF